MVCDQVANEFDGVGLLEFLEVEYEVVIFVAINGDRAAFFLINVAVGIDLGDRFCPSFDGAVKGNDDGEFGTNDKKLGSGIFRFYSGMVASVKRNVKSLSKS